jgi:hypothetical protein
VRREPFRTLRRKAGRPLACFAMLAGALPSCATPSLPVRYGYSEPPRYRVVVEKAVALVNAVRNPTLGLPLTPGWRAAQPAAIPVYLVAGPGIGNQEIAFVPRGQRLIFVSDRGLARLKSRFDGYGSAGFSYQLHEPLALVLLHETGHLYHGDRHQNRGGAPFSLADLQKPSSQVQDPEVRADLFAVSQIRNALKPRTPPTRFSAGLELGLFLPKAAWNLASQRLLGHFGGTTLHVPELFRNGNSHLNFELRFLIMEYALHRSQEARTLLTDFLQHQALADQKARRSPPLYQAPPPGRRREGVNR